MSVNRHKTFDRITANELCKQAGLRGRRSQAERKKEIPIAIFTDVAIKGGDPF